MQLEYFLSAPGDIVHTSSFVDKYAGASVMNVPGDISTTAIPIPWNRDFSPQASVQLIYFLNKIINHFSSVNT